MHSPALSDEMRSQLEERVGRVHLQQRIGFEQDYEARVFGKGRTFFHIENWYSIHSVIRNVLRLTGMHARGKRNARDIRVTENQIKLAHLPSVFDGYRILHISDLHLDMSEDIPAALINAVAGLEYDICVLTGDFRARTYGPYEAAVHGLQRVRAQLADPVIGILGNHDSIRMLPGIEELGIHILMNESLQIERQGESVFFAGIDDPHYHRADNLEKAADSIPAGAVSILLSHSPEVFRQAAYADFDVMFCGHTHAGQICLPGGIPIMCNANSPREMCSGSWQFNDLQGYTSAGSGVCVVDVRLNCPPEVTVHELKGIS